MADTKVLDKYKSLMAGQSNAPLSNSIIGLLGPMSSGKTTLACTASDFCPDTLPAAKMTDLEDVAVIPVEDGGVDSLVGLRLRVPPKNVIPFSAILADVKHPVQAWSISVDLARASGATKLVGDSISQLDVLLQGWLNTEEGKLQWGGDKFAMFRYSLGAHQVILAKVKEFLGLKVMTFTPQAVLDDLKADGTEKVQAALLMDQKAQRIDKAQGTIAQADLILGLTGKARELWTRDMSLLLGLQQVKEGSGYVRQILTTFNEKSGLATKSRFEGILAPVEEGPLCKIIRKVRAFS